MVVFLAKVFALVRGIEKGKLLSLSSRERGALFQGSLCSPLKSGGFFGKSVCTGWGLVKVWSNNEALTGQLSGLIQWDFSKKIFKNWL